MIAPGVCHRSPVHAGNPYRVLPWAVLATNALPYVVFTAKSLVAWPVDVPARTAPECEVQPSVAIGARDGLLHVWSRTAYRLISWTRRARRRYPVSHHVLPAIWN